MQRRTAHGTQPGTHHGTRSTRSRRAGALATAALTLGTLGVGGATATSAAAAPSGTSVTTLSLYPTDLLTVADPAQLTGRRVDLPTEGCGAPSACGLVERLNELDGFDLDPRLALRFDGPVDVADVIASTTVTGGGATLRIDRVVYDAATYTVYAHPRRQLSSGTTYTLAVSADRGLTAAATQFTTLSAPRGLIGIREQLDSGQAYVDAGIAAADRGLRVEAVVPLAGSSFAYRADTGAAELSEIALPLPPSGKVVFGSYLAPSWLRADRTIAQVPTTQGAPAAVSQVRLPFVMVLPAGPAPVGGWPTEVFGHGFGRSTTDVLLAADTNVEKGIATIGTDVVGHGYGPRSEFTYRRGGRTTSVPAYARGVDQDGNGTITAIEGSATAPGGPEASVSTRDTLRQTAADVMSLVRAVGRGVDVDGTPASELRTTGIGYVGQSFGGIYGTMVAGVDRKVSRSVLSVAGGPVLEVARLSTSFRPLVQQALAFAGLLNSPDPARNNFQEDMPLRGEAPVLAPVAGALPIQSFLAAATWLGRSGSPEAYAKIVPKQRVLFQVAFGDQTVPNPTSYTLLDAGNLFGRSVLYRNDRTSNRTRNPHGFLLDPLTFGAVHDQAQEQVATFLRTGTVVDPDGAGGVWQVPAPVKPLQSLNFDSPAFP